MKKYVSLFLAAVIFFSSLGIQTVYAQEAMGSVGQEQNGVADDISAEVNENPGANPEDGNSKENTDDKVDSKEDGGKDEDKGDAGKDEDKDDGGKDEDKGDADKDDAGKDEDKDDNDKDDAGKDDNDEDDDKEPGTGDGGTEENPDLKTEAAVSNFVLEYKPADDTMILKYQVNAAATGVDILVDGRPAETNYSKVYTSYIYNLPDDAEGKTYVFQVVPYELRTVEGKTVKIMGTPSDQIEYAVPYKKAVLTDVDADYDLMKKYLSIEWFGDSIAKVDIYLDGSAEPIVTGVQGNSFSTNIDWEALSQHTYRLVPFNKIGEPGAEKIMNLKVDDYTAVIDYLNVDYVEKSKEIQINWTGTNVQYVDIYMNDELLAERYTKEEFKLKYVPQAGASYLISVCPFNVNGLEGEEEEDILAEGEFEVTDINKLIETSSYGKDSDKHYTGFSKPAVDIQWMAEANANYEIYRAVSDKRSAYSCIARIKTENAGMFTYTDTNVGIGSRYYKIRRVIKEDDYIEQELATALSDSVKITVKLPKPKVDVNLTPEGAVVFTLDGKKEFVSGYTILRKNKRGSYSQIAEVTDNTFTDGDTQFGKQYSYQVKSFYYDTRTKKKIYSAVTNVKARNTVGGFKMQAQQVDDQKVKITWEAAANAEGYEVYYKSATQGDSYKLLKVTDKLKATVSVKESSRYCFMVKAYKELSREKVYFSIAETELKTGFKSPQNFRVSKTAFERDAKKNVIVRKDMLAWDKVYGAKGYYIDVYKPAKKKFKVLKKIRGGDNTSYEVSNILTPSDGTAIYRIRAYAGTRKATGEELEVKMQLAKVTGVKVKKAGSFAKLTWKRAPWAEEYRIYRSNGRNCILVGTTKKLSYTDKGISGGVAYTYYIQAVNHTLKTEGAYSDPLGYTRKIARVEDLSVSYKAEEGVFLEWLTDEEACGYIVYYREGESGEYQMLARVKGSRNNYTHKNVPEGVTCYYKVSRLERNAGGVETESEAKTVKIKSNAK